MSIMLVIFFLCSIAILISGFVKKNKKLKIIGSILIFIAVIMIAFLVFILIPSM